MVGVAIALWLIAAPVSRALDTPTLEKGVVQTLLTPPGSEQWRPMLFPKVARHTKYTREIYQGRESLRAESNCAASGVVVPVTAVELSATPILSWRWQVDGPLDISDERSKGGDDFAARVYVLFRFDSSRASGVQRLRHRIASALYDDEIPGATLSFVWTSREPPGQHWDNPFAADAKMIALAQGATSSWRTETVDVIEHYRRHFGSPIGELMGLAVMTDSDNSCQTARARFADFSFSSRPDDDDRDDDINIHNNIHNNVHRNDTNDGAPH